MERARPGCEGPGGGVALVYPPYGPSGLPSLGLALLSAGVKRLGFPCRTVYWNLDFVTRIPGGELKDKLAFYFYLTGRNWMPFNEWIFSRQVHGDALAGREAGILRRLDEFCVAAAEIPEIKARILSLRDGAAEIVDWAADQVEACSIVGINTTYYQNLPALALARRIKTRWPDKTVVLGGANCDGRMGETLLRRFPFVDFVFSGEVDHAFPEFVGRLADGAPLHDVPGILLRGPDGEVVRGPPAQPLVDLDGLPLPDFDDYLTERRRIGLDRVQEVVLALESSRGCWWGARQHCTFCGLNATGMHYRQKRAERFQMEIETIVKRYDARFIFMTDNILSTKYYDTFMDWAANARLNTNFFYEIKANVSRRQVARLADAGVTAVQPGIESFSSKILSLMRKGTTGIQNIALLKYAREYGVYVAYNILVGFPGEDREEYRRMAQEVPKLMHLRPPSGTPVVEYHRFSPYHSTPESFGIRLRPSSMYADLYPFEEEELGNLAYLFEATDGAPRDLGYVSALARQIQRWRSSYREDDCTLTWRQDGDDVVVCDRRHDAAGRHYRLQGFAAEAFHLCDVPKPLNGLMVAATAASPPADDAAAFLHSLFDFDRPADEVTIAFTGAEYAADTGSCLAPLVEAGIFYVGDDRCLALPIAETYRPVTARWLETGV